MRRFVSGSSSFAAPSAAALTAAQRGIFSDKVRAGMVLRVDKRYWRVMGNVRSQKGQNAASFHLKLTELGTGKKKEVTAAQGHDFQEVKTERVKLLFSGFDDDDFACFVYPEFSAEAGKEVNLIGDSLPELQQKFLACGMPCDVLHVLNDEDDNAAGEEDAKKGASKDLWTEVVMPTGYNYTVDKLMLRGLYRMASLAECDGVISVNDTVQLGDKVRVTFRNDGTAVFAGKATP